MLVPWLTATPRPCRKPTLERQPTLGHRTPGVTPMTHLPYVTGAYAVFILILLWDWLAARRQLHTAQRLAQHLHKCRNTPAINNTPTQ
ncbi:hypothetical protein XFEB_00795 [Xylella fastidiosa EB92.1]|nr:hypothetical protein XFEB_00795 [Xylella fastidiosa EB92.1]